MIAQLDSRYIRTRPAKTWTRLVSYLLFEGRQVTTRGRWINHFLFPFFAALHRLPKLRRVDSPIFLIGTGRSGTTVLGKALSMHRDIGFLNEPKALWHAVYPYEDVIGSYTRNQALYRLDASHASVEVRRRAERLYGAYLRLSGSRRVLDKYPEMVFRGEFLRAVFPTCRFLLLIRDGRDTCASIGDWSRSHRVSDRQETHDWWGADDRKWRLLVEQLVPEHPDLAPLGPALAGLTSDADRAAVEWVLTMREGLELQESYPDDVCRVDFEELTRSPRSTIQRILDFAGLPDDPVCQDYSARLLRPPRRRDHTPPATAIRAAFDETLARLGYTGS